MKKKIFVALSTFAEHGPEPLEILKKSGFSYVLNPLKRRVVRDEIIQWGKEAQGIIAGVEPYTADVFKSLPKLRCISRCGVGVDNIDLEKAKVLRIKVFNTPDEVIQPVVELTIGFIFDLLRNISFHTQLLRSKKWEKKSGRLLAGRKIGILGLGRIGRRVAEVLSKLDADVYGSDIKPDRSWAKRYRVRILPTDKLIESVDVLSIHTSAIEGHPFHLGKTEIAKMKPGSFIVNVARGQLLEEEVLYRALKNGHLAGAAMDVYPVEPYCGKLCELPNVVMTPHLATLTDESRLQMEIKATKNLINFLR